jgi:hypothetical protein
MTQEDVAIFDNNNKLGEKKISKAFGFKVQE